MKKLGSLVISIVMLVSCLSVQVSAALSQDIIILYENDVHCEIDGYSKLAAMKNELKETHSYVGVVSSGDFIQGSSYGVISKGEYIVNLMNLVGYDALTLGNHEFDYKLPRLMELVDIMDTKPVSCNFKKIGESESVFDSYKVVSYGDTDVAYIGITTPTAISLSSPAQFKDENGEYVYTFCVNELYDVVQENIDSAISEGADYVIALSHIGYQDAGSPVDVTDIIKNTEGLDVVLDAHSHSVIESMPVEDEGGNSVVLTSTGTKFEHIGKLTISDDGISTELIKTEDYNKTDATVDAYLQQIKTEYSEMGERVVGFSEVDLITHDEDGNRLVRNSETNLGNFCADAFRIVTGADVGYFNGGGLRAPVGKGDITFNDLLTLMPFNNQPVVAEVKGQIIKDMLEMSMRYYPEEDGSFAHISGIKLSVDTSVPTAAMADENDNFTGISGEYRVYDIMILNKDSGEYEPLDLEKEYTIASTNYYILEYGGGMTMLEDAKIVQNSGMLDVELLEQYITEHLGGVIGQQYSSVDKRITFTEGKVQKGDVVEEETVNTTEVDTTTAEKQPESEVPKTGDNVNAAVIVCAIGIGCVGLAVIQAKKKKLKV